MRGQDKLSQLFTPQVWATLSGTEQLILQSLYAHNQIGIKDISKTIGKSVVTTRNVVKSLVEKQLIEWHGSSKNDPSQYYTIKY